MGMHHQREIKTIDFFKDGNKNKTLY